MESASPDPLIGMPSSPFQFITDSDSGTLESTVLKDRLLALFPDSPMRELREGEWLFREGEPLGMLYLLTEGQVALSKSVRGHETVFHSDSVGNMIGLMALSAEDPITYFSCRAVKDSRLLCFSHEDLRKAMSADQDLVNLFLRTIVVASTVRTRHSVDRHTEIQHLNSLLAEERDTLHQTLETLKNTQMKLVQSEKLATLGQLVSGIAHELNNPTAAIQRAASYVQENIPALTREHPEHDLLEKFASRFDQQRPLSSREQRQTRRQLEEAGIAADTARRFVAMGFTDAGEIRELLHSAEDQELRVADLETLSDTYKFLRNIHSGSERIGQLVASLRSYSRTGTVPQEDINVYTGLEETLTLVGHQLSKVTVERRYEDLPLITCIPGELNQVWTNLITNAVQAMNGTGTLGIETAVDGEWIRVSIQDSGPGIPPETQTRIFEINFTTKQGKGDFGIGLGLPICKQIIEQHNGRLEFESQPGLTRFDVYLPRHVSGASS